MQNSERTSIEDLATIGTEINEDHLQLAAGGMIGRTAFSRGLTGGRVAPTYDRDYFRMDTCTDPTNDF